MATTARRGDAATTAVGSRTSLFSAFAGLTALAVLLQGLWAGIFLPAGKGGTYADTWVEVHQHGGEASILLALITTVIGFVRLRQRRELWIGAAALTVLLIVEAWLGGLVSDGASDSAAAIHVPLALAIMALTVWLPLRARQAARS